MVDIITPDSSKGNTGENYFKAERQLVSHSFTVSGRPGVYGSGMEEINLNISDILCKK